VSNPEGSVEITGSPKAPSSPANSPDFVELARFLLSPLVDGADQIHLDCEVLAGGRKLSLRAAIEGNDRGRVLGRGGRNIQAIRTVLQAAAQTGQTVHLEIFGTEPEGQGDAGGDRGIIPQGDRPRRDVPPPKRRPKPEAAAE
jgi:uncharacterized protein